MSQGIASNERLLRLEDVKSRIGFGRTKIYAMIRDGSFPKPYKLSRKAARWSEREISDWIDRALHEARTI